MKKIIAAAVATAFMAPAFAADVTINGDFITDYRDTNGASSVNNDHDVNFTVTTETSNGYSVRGSLGLDGTSTTNDGNSTLQISGPFGSFAIGDVAGPTDRIDGITDPSYFMGNGSNSADDVNMLFTAPTVVEGLNIVISHSADSGAGGANSDTEGTGYGIDYSFGNFSVHYAEINYEDDTNENSAGIQGSFNGIGFAYLSSEQEDVVGTVLEDTSLMVSYTMGDVFVFVEQFEAEDGSNALTDDETVVGVHYSLGGGVTLFGEMSDDEVTATEDTTSIGIAFTF